MSLENRARVVRPAKHLALPLLCGIAMQVAGLPYASPAVLAGTVPSAGTADSGTYRGTIGLAGGDDWYSFVPISSGPAAVGSCASDMTADYQLDVRDAAGQPIVGAGAPWNCQFVTLSVTAGQTYQVHVYDVSGNGPYVSAWSVNGTSVTWPLSITIAGTNTSQATDLMALTPGSIDGTVCGPSLYTFSLLNGGGLTVAHASNQQTNCAAWSYQDYNQGLFRARIDVPSGGGGGTWTGSVVTQVLTSTTTTATPSPTASTSTPVSTPTPTQTATPTTTPTPGPCQVPPTPTFEPWGSVLSLSATGGFPPDAVTANVAPPGTGEWAPRPVYFLEWDKTVAITSGVGTGVGSYVVVPPAARNWPGWHTIDFYDTTGSAPPGMLVASQPYLIYGPSNCWTPTPIPSSTTTPVPTTTATPTPLPPTATATSTALPPTNTPTPWPTNTVVPATPTPTAKPRHKH